MTKTSDDVDEVRTLGERLIFEFGLCITDSRLDSFPLPPLLLIFSPFLSLELLIRFWFMTKLLSHKLRPRNGSGDSGARIEWDYSDNDEASLKTTGGRLLTVSKDSEFVADED